MVSHLSSAFCNPAGDPQLDHNLWRGKVVVTLKLQLDGGSVLGALEGGCLLDVQPNILASSGWMRPAGLCTAQLLLLLLLLGARLKSCSSCMHVDLSVRMS